MSLFDTLGLSNTTRSKQLDQLKKYREEAKKRKEKKEKEKAQKKKKRESVDKQMSGFRDSVIQELLALK